MTEKREILFQLSLLGGRKMEKDEHVTYQHFILESLSDVFKIIQPNGWVASVDLKDAFYTIPIHNAHQKYFKLMLYQKFYKYLGMPNGYSDAMRVFTKIILPPFANTPKAKFYFCHIC